MIGDESRVLRPAREMTVKNRLTSRQGSRGRGGGRQGGSCDALCHVIFSRLVVFLKRRGGDGGGWGR